MPKRVALYLRVSTAEQTTENQRRELLAVADQRGWRIGQVFEDAGVSGGKSREQRPEFDRMLKAATRREFDLLMTWSVDRLGRSLQDLVDCLGELHAVGCGLYLHQQGIDTTTPSGKAMFQMMGVFAEFERAMTVERINAGLARARAQGKRLGRPRLNSKMEHQIVLALRAGGLGLHKIARQFKVGTGTVQRIKAQLL
ncbi:MAG: recombinase family protein [Alphaproteobacteria bacterium]|nr:recombinase family protein [Alphaproteobacteria bacterium]